MDVDTSGFRRIRAQWRRNTAARRWRRQTALPPSTTISPSRPGRGLSIAFASAGGPGDGPEAASAGGGKADAGGWNAGKPDAGGGNMDAGGAEGACGPGRSRAVSGGSSEWKLVGDKAC